MRNNKKYDKKDNKIEERKPKNQLKEYKVNKQTTLMEFLLETLTSTSRNNIKGLLSRKQVLVDGSVVSQFDFQLTKGDSVQISKYPMTVTKTMIGKHKKSPLKIIFEDDNIIVIDKPSGLLSIATDNEKEATAYRMLMDYVREKDKHNRIYVVHRLDKDTSGVLMVAKNEKYRDALQNNWNDIVKTREYVAIVEGNLEEKIGTIKSYLRETKTNLMYSSHKKGDGQEAITHYRVTKETLKYSMLNVNIDTGRKNQIRVHMADIGHKIIGDDKYQSTKNPLKRLGLHAHKLEFIDPITKELRSFKSNIPGDFNRFFAGQKTLKEFK